MEYTLTKTGVTVTINVSYDSHTITYTKGGVIYNYLIKGFKVDFSNKTIQVNYSVSLSDSDGNFLSKKLTTYTEEREERFADLYNATAFGEPSGDFYAKQCVNGILDLAVGFKAFGPTGSLLS